MEEADGDCSSKDLEEREMERKKWPERTSESMADGGGRGARERGRRLRGHQGVGGLWRL